MPPVSNERFRALYRLVLNDLVIVHHTWSMCRELYGNESHVSVLNQAAPAFFAWIQNILTWDVYLAISRLLDPARSGGSAKAGRASIDGLRLEIEATNSKLARQLRDDWKALRARAKALLAARDSKLAHRDADTMLGHRIAHKGIAPSDVFDVLRLLREYMTKISDAFGFPMTAYNSTDAGPAVASLLWHLKAGIKADKHG